MSIVMQQFLIHFVVDFLIFLYNDTPTRSPVVHQFDRHKHLSDYFYKHKASEYLRKWKAADAALQGLRCISCS
jgi:hypothetical protein